MATHFSTMTPEALAEWATDRFLNHFRAHRQKMIFDKIVKRKNSNRAYEEHWEVSGLGTFAVVPEGTPIPYDEPVQGNRARITHTKYGLGYRVTEEMRDDDRWDVVSQMADDLMDAGRDHQERIGHRPWNTAFDTTTYTTLDGAAFISTTHTSLKGGGTRSNALSPAADLTPEAVEALLTQASLMVDEQGRYIPFNPTNLFTHVNNRWEAERIFESQYRPFSADNDINVLANNRLGTNMLFSPYLTDTDAFFLFDREAMMVLWFDRKKMTPATGTDFDTQDVKTTVRYRAGVGVPKWEGVFGSQGA